MNWFRDNIVKIIIILVIAILVIIFAVACSAFSGGGNKPVGTETGTSYQELETKLSNAAINYVDRNKELLPKSSSVNSKINLDTLVSNRMIKELHALDDSNVTCSGYVEIIKNDETNSYRYNPYIRCGNYYETTKFANYLINKGVVTSGEGLYIINNEYIYKGDNPNNYIKIGDNTYRILRITEDGNLKLISTKSTSNSYIYDDRYNSDIEEYYGINDYSLSRIKVSLEKIYDGNVEYEKFILSDLEKSYIIDYDFCVGKRPLQDTNISSNAECSVVSKQKIGSINIEDYYLISTSGKCLATNDKECNNYNYLYNYDNTFYSTIVSNADNSYTYLVIDGGIISSIRTTRNNRLYPVIYLDSEILYLSGNGTSSNPYILR